MKRFDPLGIVIPVYQSFGHLPKLVDHIFHVLENMPCASYHLVMVDDGSSPPLASNRVISVSSRLTLLRHQKNQGKGAALLTGFNWLLENTQVKGIVTLDADGQHPPEGIPKLLACATRHQCDLVIGYRKRLPGKMPASRIVSNTLTSLIISLLIGQPVRDSQCGFRFYSRALLEHFVLSERRFHLESEALLRAGWGKWRIGWVSIPTIYNGSPSAIRHLPDTLNFVQLVLKLTLRRILGRLE